MVREADLPRPHPAGAAAEHARRGRRVVRGEPRWPPHQPASLREDAGDGVQRRDLERLLGRQVGQDRRDALGDRRLAGPAGADQHRGVAARRGDLDGVADVLEPVEVAQVDVGQAVLAAPGRQRAGRGADDRVGLGHLGAAEHGGHLGQRADTEDRHPRHEAGLAGLRLGHEDAGDAVGGSGDDHGQHPRHRSQGPGHGQLADERPPLQQVGRQLLVLLVGRHDRHRDREVVVGAALGEVGGREQDRHPLGRRPPSAVVVDRHPHPVARLGQGLVHPADDRGVDQARGDVDLDVDHVAVGALERQRASGREGHQPTPSTCSTSTGPPRGASTPTRSMRTSSGWQSCTSSHRAPSRLRRSALRRSTASSGAP